MSWTQRQRAVIIANAYSAWGLYGKRALDVGCGNGVVSVVLKDRLGLELIGTDVIDYTKTGIPFAKMDDAHRLPFGACEFDVVMLNDVLHHTDDHEALLREAVRVGKTVCIFEDERSPLLVGVDLFLNYLYSPKMARPLTFRDMAGWENMFTHMNLRYRRGSIKCPWWYPFRHMAYQLYGWG